MENGKDTSPYNSLEGDRPELSFNLHEGSEEQVSIIVVHNNSPEHLSICLQSIAVTTINNNYEIVVVDNNSNEESQEFLTSVEENGVVVVRNDENSFWSAAANKGFAAANKNSKYIVFMHSDVVVLNSGWLDTLINVSDTQNCGMVGVEMNSFIVSKQKIDFIEEWAVAFTRECFEEIGPWPENLPYTGHSFILTLRAQRKGHKPQIVKTPILHHYRIFGIDINEHERFIEKARNELPRMINDVQTQPVSV